MEGGIAHVSLAQLKKLIKDLPAQTPPKFPCPVEYNSRDIIWGGSGVTINDSSASAEEANALQEINQFFDLSESLFYRTRLINSYNNASEDEKPGDLIDKLILGSENADNNDLPNNSSLDSEQRRTAATRLILKILSSGNSASNQNATKSNRKGHHLHHHLKKGNQENAGKAPGPNHDDDSWNFLRGIEVHVHDLLTSFPEQLIPNIVFAIRLVIERIESATRYEDDLDDDENNVEESDASTKSIVIGFMEELSQLLNLLYLVIQGICLGSDSDGLEDSGLEAAKLVLLEYIIPMSGQHLHCSGSRPSSPTSLPALLLAFSSKFTNGGANVRLPVKKLLMTASKGLGLLVMLKRNSINSPPNNRKKNNEYVDSLRNDLRRLVGLDPWNDYEEGTTSGNLTMKTTLNEYISYQEKLSANYPFFFPDNNLRLESSKRSSSPSYFENSISLLPPALREGLMVYKRHLYQSYSSIQKRREIENLNNLRRLRQQHSASNASFQPGPGKSVLVIKHFLHDHHQQVDDNNSSLISADGLLLLERIDKIYSDLLPNLWPTIVFLLKAVLSLLSSKNKKDGGSEAGANNTFGIYLPPLSIPTHPLDPSTGTEEEKALNEARERQLISLTISSIILTLLKQCKLCHIFQFENICKHFMDANGILLFLKLLSSQDIEKVILLKSTPDNNGKKDEEGQVADSETLKGANKAVEDNSSGYLDISELSHLELSEQCKNILKNSSKNSNNNLKNSPKNYSNYNINLVNLSCTLNYLRILQKVVKGKEHRIGQLLQFKSLPILKRLLKCDNESIQRYTLKLIREQMPYQGKKFRIANMHIVSAMFCHLRPVLLVDPTCMDSNGGGAIPNSSLTSPIPGSNNNNNSSNINFSVEQNERSIKEEKELRQRIDEFHKVYYSAHSSHGQNGLGNMRADNKAFSNNMMSASSLSSIFSTSSSEHMLAVQFLKGKHPNNSTSSKRETSPDSKHRDDHRHAFIQPTPFYLSSLNSSNFGSSILEDRNISFEPGFLENYEKWLQEQVLNQKDDEDIEGFLEFEDEFGRDGKQAGQGKDNEDKADEDDTKANDELKLLEDENLIVVDLEASNSNPNNNNTTNGESNTSTGNGVENQISKEDGPQEGLFSPLTFQTDLITTLTVESSEKSPSAAAVVANPEDDEKAFLTGLVVDELENPNLMAHHSNSL